MKMMTSQINLFDCVHSLMNNPNEMNIFLSELVNFIDMNIVSEKMVNQKNPNSFKYNPIDKDSSEYGVSGCIILVESHICAHSWENKNFLNIVITSCKEYDPLIAALWILSYTKSNIYKFETIYF